MSTQPVSVKILGQEVTGEIVAERPVADYGDGPRDEVVVDVDGSRFRVDEDDVE